jgi:hypothetical protein
VVLHSVNQSVEDLLELFVIVGLRVELAEAGLGTIFLGTVAATLLYSLLDEAVDLLLELQGLHCLLHTHAVACTLHLKEEVVVDGGVDRVRRLVTFLDQFVEYLGKSVRLRHPGLLVESNLLLYDPEEALHVASFLCQKPIDDLPLDLVRDCSVSFKSTTLLPRTGATVRGPRLEVGVVSSFITSQTGRVVEAPSRAKVVLGVGVLGMLLVQPTRSVRMCRKHSQHLPLILGGVSLRALHSATLHFQL